ncbi:MAG TPA: LemA family protein [Bacteroidia bacterium]|jgi:LemA protein|nr:LemA family protein [Bacteroidia bacterium]HRG53076.1 LemA family protein [Bacteroidia bacterium]
MKKGTIIWLSIAGVLILWGIFSSNSLAKSEEGVTAQWQQVEVAYQARMDKTKNLFEIVQSSADFEKGTLKEVMEARSRATSIQINADNLTPEKMAEFEKAQNQFGASLGRLMAVAENYPQLQTTTAFRDFQAQYEGMENRIATERGRFNEAAQSYNTSLRIFPKVIIAKLLGYQKKAYFESQAGAETAPDIKSMRDSERNK